jgi:hypothetical protein
MKQLNGFQKSADISQLKNEDGNIMASLEMVFSQSDIKNKIEDRPKTKTKKDIAEGAESNLTMKIGHKDPKANKQNKQTKYNTYTCVKIEKRLRSHAGFFFALLEPFEEKQKTDACWPPGTVSVPRCYGLEPSFAPGPPLSNLSSPSIDVNAPHIADISFYMISRSKGRRGRHAVP